jgi:hypothetical protein
LRVLDYDIFYYRDNVPAILLSVWELEARMFNGELAAGPVPALFSEDGEASQEALLANPRKAHQDLQRAMKIFFMPELVGAGRGPVPGKKTKVDTIACEK